MEKQQAHINGFVVTERFCFLFNSKAKCFSKEPPENTILPINGQMLVAPILELMKPMKTAKRRLKERIGNRYRNFRKNSILFIKQMWVEIFGNTGLDHVFL